MLTKLLSYPSVFVRRLLILGATMATHDFACNLVLARADESVPQMAVRRPFGKLDLLNELRREPDAIFICSLTL